MEKELAGGKIFSPYKIEDLSTNENFWATDLRRSAN